VFTDRHCVPEDASRDTAEGDRVLLARQEVLVKVGPTVQGKANAFAGAYSCRVLSVNDEAEQVRCRDPLNQRVRLLYNFLLLIPTVQIWPRGKDNLDLAVLQLSSTTSKLQRYFLPATFDDVRSSANLNTN